MAWSFLTWFQTVHFPLVALSWHWLISCSSGRYSFRLISNVGTLNSASSQSIRKAKRDVQTFAQEIIGWVSREISTFQDGGADRFSLKAWDNLEEMRYINCHPQVSAPQLIRCTLRSLVDDICKWAKMRLVCIHSCPSCRRGDKNSLVHNAGRWLVEADRAWLIRRERD
ncbi:hypothetical protein PILCRDRAFT_440997 [Piloderma croceum F 1598]|uniref:Uncharacterized protein n=1 Tax=Piloderma croceum (strain F 1598) TaxID=765440 RepID=A0A0C3FV70_PILCF|nr:hypothetical protein PILCRDRAFT_440997 [Piloderma croceum F 1598]